MRTILKRQKRARQGQRRHVAAIGCHNCFQTAQYSATRPHTLMINYGRLTSWWSACAINDPYESGKSPKSRCHLAHARAKHEQVKAARQRGQCPAGYRIRRQPGRADFTAWLQKHARHSAEPCQSAAPSGLMEQAASTPELAHHSMVNVPLAALVDNPAWVRQPCGPEVVAELAGSIKTTGLLTPPTVRKVENRFEIIDGHLRKRALETLGQHQAPVLLVERSDRQVRLDTFVNNMCRTSLSDYELAKACAALLQEGVVTTQAELAQALGCSQPTISNLLAMVNLPSPVREFLDAHPQTLSSKSARRVAALCKEYPQHVLTIVEGLKELQPRLTPQTLADWVRQRVDAPKPPSSSSLAGSGIRHPNGELLYTVSLRIAQREFVVRVVHQEASLTVAARAIYDGLKASVAQQSISA